MTQEKFKQFIEVTFGLSRGNLEYQKKIIDYLMSFMSSEDFEGIDFDQTYKEIIDRFWELRGSGHHPVTVGEPDGTIKSAIDYTRDSINSIENTEARRQSLMYDLLKGTLERDAHYLSSTNEEARPSARKSDFRDRILKPFNESSGKDTNLMWHDLYRYFKDLMDGNIELTIRKKKELFEIVAQVIKRWPNYYAEIAFFDNAELEQAVTKEITESKQAYIAELIKLR